MITVFPNITNTKDGIPVTPHLIVESIRQGGKNDKTKDLVSVIRKTVDKSKRNSTKGQLPCIMWSGLFKKRSKSGLLKHSGLICLDFDDVPDIESAKTQICKDKYTYCCFISPSGNGLKVVVKIPQDANNHIKYFKSLANHYDWIDVDSAAKDVSRVCYSSYDPDVYFNPESEQWTEIVAVPVQKKLPLPTPSTPSSEEVLPTEEALEIIKKKIDKDFEYVSGNKHEHMKHFTWFANRVGVPESDCVAFYQRHYDKQKVPSLMANIYKNSSGDFNTTPMTGTPKNNQPGESKSEYLTFWLVKSTEKKGAFPVFSRQKFISWLKDFGFARYHYTDNNWVLIQHENNIVQKVGKSQLKQFVFDYINKMPFQFDGIYRSQLYELIARGISSFFSDELLEILPPLEIETNRDTQDEGYLYFLNGVVRCTDKGFRIMQYSELDGYVWKDQITDRDFSPTKDFDNDYKSLLAIVSGGEDDNQDLDVFESRMSAIESVVGFLLHSYKDPRYCPAVIINDQYINEDNPEGGTGKGIFLNGISHLKRMIKIDGKLHKMDSTFVFQAVDTDTQVMVFEDVLKGWNFEILFPVVTEGITVEKKGKDSFFISFKSSPKMVVTTNYTIKGDGTSHQRRRFELEFHGFFRDKPPFEYFGKRLFDDWTDDEWQRFDNYMAYCLVRFLQHGLEKPPIVNLKERRLRERTHPEFVDFVRQWLEPGQFTSKHLHQQLNKQNPDFEKYNQGTITRWIKYYMGQTGCLYDTGRIETKLGYLRGFIVTHVPPKPSENNDHIEKTEVVSDHKKVVKKDMEEKDNKDLPF